MQVLGRTSEILAVEPLCERFRAFGWEAFRVDGHNLKRINKTLSEANMSREKPVVVIFDTIKGYGVSFMKNQTNWHYRTLTKSELSIAFNEL